MDNVANTEKLSSCCCGSTNEDNVERVMDRWSLPAYIVGYAIAFIAAGVFM